MATGSSTLTSGFGVASLGYTTGENGGRRAGPGRAPLPAMGDVHPTRGKGGALPEVAAAHLTFGKWEAMARQGDPDQTWAAEAVEAALKTAWLATQAAPVSSPSPAVITGSATGR